LDFGLYLRVLWRFRLIVLTGVCLGLALAFLSFVRPSFEGGKLTFGYRQTEVWESEARLFVTQKGFPWGRTAPEYLPADTEGGAPPVPTSDPGRLAALATLYAEFAKGDYVQSIVGSKARLVIVEPVPAPPLSSPPILPLISIRALGPTPRASAELARKTSRALLTFIRRQQSDARIPDSARVQVELLSQPIRPIRIKDRGKTIPIIVFMAVVMAACALAFVLENLRPRGPRAKPREFVEPFAEPDAGERDARQPAEAPLRSA
jgi:hypothetical protein